MQTPSLAQRLASSPALHTKTNADKHQRACRTGTARLSCGYAAWPMVTLRPPARTQSAELPHRPTLWSRRPLTLRPARRRVDAAVHGRHRARGAGPGRAVLGERRPVAPLLVHDQRAQRALRVAVPREEDLPLEAGRQARQRLPPPRDLRGRGRPWWRPCCAHAWNCRPTSCGTTAGAC